MARLAIFIDNGYLISLARSGATWVDYEKLSAEIRQSVAESTQEPLDLLRTYVYDCLPYQSNPPTPAQEEQFGRKRRFLSFLQKLPHYEVREGRLTYRGDDALGAPIYQQKGVDLRIGLDIALLSAKHQVTHAAIVSGDSDLLPALEAAQNEGTVVWLVHGPTNTYARELWNRADARLSIDAAFLKRVERQA